MANMVKMVKMAEMATGQPKNHFTLTHKSHDIILLTVSGDGSGYKKAQIILKKVTKIKLFSADFKQIVYFTAFIKCQNIYLFFQQRIFLNRTRNYKTKLGSYVTDQSTINQ